MCNELLCEQVERGKQIERGERATSVMTVDRLRSKRFPVVRFQLGYAQDAVDDFLDDVAARLPRG
ncbi:DivIVA domain-containing protein [Pseudoclavibacter sp. CFCC 11306]|uniref:DivIVA domain-containing protein n=1 Tax=Pseudoclavibacter sp. CFCC 11306 TaxID=1564493 RepID=UPI00130196E6|nr:DivIVA domain-containing protein [Pseudoclavibacter sp. CFCC 11306]KAB1656962.1 DivIVA domain-containing protein [Pseudoclavibacter sp. CFCC 11306]